MKLTKKLLALLLVFVMVFSLASCFGDPDGEPTVQGGCTSHVDNDGDGKCDNEGCDAPVGGYVPTPVSPDAAAAYVNAIWAAVETAKTVTATLDMSNTEAESDTVDKDGNVIYEAYNNTMTAHFDLTLAMSENGLNLKAIGNAAMGDETQSFETYLVDGLMYSRMGYMGEWTEWTVEPFENPEGEEGIISQFTAIITGLLPEDFEVTDDMIAEVKAVFAQAIAALMTVNPDGSFGSKLDLKPVIQEVVTFLSSITETTTVEEVINKALSYVDPEMTISAILDDIATYGEITVGEIYTAINDAFLAEFEMGVNDIKNLIFAEESITSMLIANGSLDEETLASIQEMDIDAMMLEYATLKIDDLVYMMIAASPESGEPEVGGPFVDEYVDEIEVLGEELIGDGASLVKVLGSYRDYVQAVYADENGLGYVVHVLVLSQYGTPETETLLYIDSDGKLAGVNKLVWKSSDANPDLNYYPPADDVVDAFYAKLTGKNENEFKAAFTGESVELVSGATFTSTRLVDSILAAFDTVERIETNRLSEGTLVEMIAQAKAMLAAPFVQMAGEDFAKTVEAFKSLDLRAIYSYINIKIGSDLSIEKIEMCDEIDLTVTTSTIQYVEVPGADGSTWEEVECTVTLTAKQKIIFTITSVSSIETTITAPEVEAA